MLRLCGFGAFLLESLDGGLDVELVVGVEAEEFDILAVGLLFGDAPDFLLREPLIAGFLDVSREGFLDIAKDSLLLGWSWLIVEEGDRGAGSDGDIEDNRIAGGC